MSSSFLTEAFSWANYIQNRMTLRVVPHMTLEEAWRHENKILGAKFFPWANFTSFFQKQIANLHFL